MVAELALLARLRRGQLGAPEEPVEGPWRLTWRRFRRDR
jgi:hypothetical protein